MKKTRKQLLAESLNEAINPKPKAGSLHSNVRALLDNYRPEKEPSSITNDFESSMTSHTNFSDTSHTNFSDTTNTRISDGNQSKSPFKLSPLAPTQNFHKVSNTIAKEAIPQGVFKAGKSKQLYDVLYFLTRGAIKPTRLIRINKLRLMELANIGARATFDTCIRNLSDQGLIKKSVVVGERGGNEYEVLLPEEVGLSKTSMTNISMTSTTKYDLNQVRLVTLEPSHTSETSNVVNIGIIDDSKTLIKTNKENTDDERYRAAFKDLEKVLNKAVENLTGREASESDSERWKQVADILAAQLELIASRTTISNAPAVLAEHLHRQLNSQRALERIGLITPTEARAAKKISHQNQSTQAEETIPEEITSEETIPDLYLCPDCDGTTYWNPDGKGRQAGCLHPRLEEARERAALEG